MKRRLFLSTPFLAPFAQPVVRRHISGVYPRLAMFNSQGECGTGAVVPWAGRLWVVTYSPRQPGGSDDKLYETGEQLNRTTRPESIGGTPANRMIHREPDQLFIGPYAIDSQRNVRAIPYEQMYGRPTANARHLTDPAGKIYFASMEEGFYEVDVRTLAVRELYEDANRAVARKTAKDIAGPSLPGYHGKGFYSGQGRVVYANNGEPGGGSLPPDIPSGCLAEWNGQDWKVARRNRFCEVTGPGGISGNPNPDKDPIWAVGWDHRSVILMLLDRGKWHSYRLPKRWGERIVLGCDDTAMNEFFNTRRAKGKIAGPGQSQSNLWFIPPARLSQFGPSTGRGGIWVKDNVKAGIASGPYLFSGFDHRTLHLAHEDAHEAAFQLEVDRAGDGSWSPLREIKVPARGYVPSIFTRKEDGAWLRLKPLSDCAKAAAYLHYANEDRRAPAPPRSRGVEGGGYVWARGEKKGTLLLATADALYELDADLILRRLDDRKTHGWMRQNLAPPAGVLEVDAASVVYTGDAGKRWRLPKGDPSFDAQKPGVRISREVSTERDLFNAHGTFYELPSGNAGGIAMVRPVCTHNLHVADYCSWRGLTVMSGLPDMPLPAGEFVRSADGKARLWLGVSDDLWQFGKPVGKGGPWFRSRVKAGQPSGPYLLTGYGEKRLFLSHDLRSPLGIRVEVDLTGMGLWVTYRDFDVPAGEGIEHVFPKGYSAYWLRTIARDNAEATATLVYL